MSVKVRNWHNAWYVVHHFGGQRKTRSFGKKTAEELRKMRYGKSKAKKVFLLYGEGEMSENLNKLGKIKIIKNTEHQFTKNYKEAVLNII